MCIRDSRATRAAGSLGVRWLARPGGCCGLREGARWVRPWGPILNPCQSGWPPSPENLLERLWPQSLHGENPRLCQTPAMRIRVPNGKAERLGSGVCRLSSRKARDAFEARFWTTLCAGEAGRDEGFAQPRFLLSSTAPAIICAPPPLHKKRRATLQNFQPGPLPCVYCTILK